MRNCPAWVVSYMAHPQGGWGRGLLNGWWQPHEMQHALDMVSPKISIADAPRAKRIEGVCGGCQLVACRSRNHWKARWRPCWTGADLEAPLPEVDPEDDATILFTSGSTGEAKGALSTHRAVTTGVYTYATGLIVLLGIMTEENRAPTTKRTLINVPLFHVTGEVPVMLNSFVISRTMVMMPKWDAGEALRLIDKEGITYFVGVPTMSMELMNHPDRGQIRLSSLTDIAAGGAPRPVSHVERLAKEFPKAQPALGYGLTETNAVGCSNFWGSYAAKPNSTGAPQAFRRSRDPRNRRRAFAAVRARGNRDPVRGEHQMLLGQSGRDRGSVHGRPLLPYRGHRLPRRGWLSIHRRPKEGHHHPRRREHRLLPRWRPKSTPAPRSPRPAYSVCPTTGLARFRRR